MTAVTIITEIRARDGIVCPPADNGALAGLLKRALIELGAAPPDAYMDFLRIANGANADGVLLYPIADQRWQEMDMPGLVDINLRRRRYRDGLADLILLGEADDDFLAWRPAQNDYRRLDRLSLDVYQQTGSFTELVMACFPTSLS